MNLKNELIKQNKELENGVLLEQRINTESFFLLVKSKIKKEVLNNKNGKIVISFMPLNRENYREMLNLNIDLNYLQELCLQDGIDFYIDYVLDDSIKWQTFFFEVNLKKEKDLKLVKN